MRIFVCLVFFLTSVAPSMGNDKEKQDEAILFTNQELLSPIFEKLYQLENSRACKVNIVHVGDSHIQADFFTDAIRKLLQEQFGDGGYGFTFPYSLMRTNGTRNIHYSSSATWKGRLNVSPISQAVDIGLSGIGLYTDSKNFTVQLNTNKEYSFNAIKVIYSTQEPQYQISLTQSPITSFVEEKSTNVNHVVHRIKRGESLSNIAARYNVTVQALKAGNNLKSNNIQAGRTLNIPNAGAIKRIQEPTVKQNIDYVDIETYPYYSSYISNDPMNRVSIFDRGTTIHDINGFVIENDKPGLVYHAVGVNGAKLSDFNKYPLFFKQLHILQPDLVILSFGTNESYQKLSADQFLLEMETMIAEIKKENPLVSILVMTPPPSLLRRQLPNALIGEYSHALLHLADYPVWDLYGYMDGQEGVMSNGKYADIIAKDKIHYSIAGYKIQGEKFAEDFLKAYKYYKENKQN